LRCTLVQPGKPAAASRMAATAAVHRMDFEPKVVCMTSGLIE
jgi:hypothetical protein